MSIQIADIKQAFELTKLANNRRYVLVPELAKGLGVKPLTLMQQIVDQPKLIYTENVWSYKDIKVKRRLFASDPKSAYTTTEQVKNKSLGLGVLNVYLEAKDNFRTEEWLSDKLISSAKFINVSEADDYGYIQGYYLSVDEPKEGDHLRLHLWRNTPEKLKWLSDNGYTTPGGFTFGGFGDSYQWKSSHVITSDSLEKLQKIGWSFNKVSPLSKT